MALVALLALASIVALTAASGIVEQVRSIGAVPSSTSGPSTAAAYEPR